MKLGHRHRPSALIHTEAVHRDGGYVLVMFAILLIPVMLLAGFSVDEPLSYGATPDFRAYRSTRLEPSREVGMLRALHDQSITEARDALLVGERVVAVMGGHALPRSTEAYRSVINMQS